MKSNKGFTMVEILAVVVILGIVVLISTNLVLKQLSKSKKQAFITDVEQFIKSTNYDTLVKDKLDEYVVYSFPDNGIEILPKVNHSGFMIKDENDNIRIQIWNSSLEMCAVKSFSDKEVTIDESIKTEDDCKSFLPNVTSSEISVKSITGENVNYNLQASCYTLDSNNKITNFDTINCGTVLVIPNKINGENVAGIDDSFVTNASKDFTSFYLIGVKNITETPAQLLSANNNLKKIVISMLPNLETIKGYLGNNSSNLNTFYLTKCPKLTAMSSEVADLYGEFGILSAGNTNLENVVLEELPKLEVILSSLEKIPVKKINISNFDSLTIIKYAALSDLTGDTEVTVSNNPNLERITNGPFSNSQIKRMSIFNNPSLTILTDGAITGRSGAQDYIDELIMYNNPNLETIQNSLFQNYEFNTIKLYDMPKLKNIRYGAFQNIKADVVDFSGLELEVFDFSSFSGSSINTLILPPTITSFNYGDASNFNSIVKEKIEFGGSNKCSLINLFRTDNGNGTYTYKVDKNKLPDCP